MRFFKHYGFIGSAAISLHYICNAYFVANFALSRLLFRKVIDMSSVSCFFTHSVYYSNTSKVITLSRDGCLIRKLSKLLHTCSATYSVIFITDKHYYLFVIYFYIYKYSTEETIYRQ